MKIPFGRADEWKQRGDQVVRYNKNTWPVTARFRKSNEKTNIRKIRYISISLAYFFPMGPLFCTIGLAYSTLNSTFFHSTKLAPTITSNIPGSTSYRIAFVHIAGFDASTLNTTVFVSPGAKDIREKSLSSSSA